jgi:hypothetical protein
LSRISFATCCRSFFVRSNHLHAYSIALKRDQCLEARSDRSTARVHALVSVENPIAAPDALHGGTDEDLDGPSDAPESKEVRERPELVADLRDVSAAKFSNPGRRPVVVEHSHELG